MKIAFFSAKSYDKIFFDKANQQYGFKISYFNESLNTNTVESCANFDVVCAFVNDSLDANLIAILAKQRIKCIALRSAGFNHVDVEACRHLGLPVVRVPEYSPHAVAEHTLALLLTLNRKTHKSYNRVREGNFSLNGLMGFDLFGKTIGIIGLGKIGKCFAQICHGLGMSIIAHDPEPDLDFQQQVPVTFTELDQLISKSDVISLHCPLVDSNQHMINQSSIDQMKSGVFILNTGRGGLIDASALISGLKQKKIGAVGLDVYEQEGPLFFEDHSAEVIDDDVLMRLTTFPNVLITSHQGFFTEEALSNIAETTLANIDCLHRGISCPNQI